MRKRYRKREGATVMAVRVPVDHHRGFDYLKPDWSEKEQRCEPGDWIVINRGEFYTVAAREFDRTYSEVEGHRGEYEKHAHVWVEVATQSGVVQTAEGETRYEPGDCLVAAEEEGDFGYAMNPDDFDAMYEPVD